VKTRTVIAIVAVIDLLLFAAMYWTLKDGGVI
jgi:hypothetical protein